MAKKSKKLNIDEIGELGAEGKDVLKYFNTKQAKMKQPIQRVNVDFTKPMLDELDSLALHLNISRQALIKTLYITQ